MARPFNYSRVRNRASALIARFGQRGSIQRPGAPVSDPNEPWNAEPGAPVSVPCDMVVTSYAAREVDGTLILATDTKILISVRGVDSAPTTNDRIVDAKGKDYEVVNVDELSPAGTELMWTVQARG